MSRGRESHQDNSNTDSTLWEYGLEGVLVEYKSGHSYWDVLDELEDDMDTWRSLGRPWVF